MENRHIAFSPPDITEEEITEVVDKELRELGKISHEKPVMED